MPSKLYKLMLAALAAALLVGGSFQQRQLVQERAALGLSRYTELKGAPPILTLTTVALGGFRGLISNLLWIRASNLQDNDKFFEMMQLAEWITKLEPHFTQVWLVQAWNMAYNISVKFKDPADRWRWVKAGIELLRDEGLRYNPTDVLMYRELSWFFQHKMGADLDDAHLYYKQMWANQLTNVFGKETPNLELLVNPTNDEQRHRVMVLTNVYKMDPRFMKDVDDRLGPLEWRLPEAHAIYWASLGLKYNAENKQKINTNDTMTLRRSIFQSMQMSYQRGHLISNKVGGYFEFGPNLDIIPHVSEQYLIAYTNEPSSRDNIDNAHKNFVRDAIYQLYINDRKADAMVWFKKYAERYPGKSLLMGTTNATPDKITLDQYAAAMVSDQINDGDKNRLEGVLEGLEAISFKSLILDEDEKYNAMQNLIQRAVEHYYQKTKGREAVALTPLKDLRLSVLNRMLNGGIPPRQAAILRTKLHLQAPTSEPPPGSPTPSTNAPPIIK